jgi:DNA-binding NtrC family response regulator
MNSTPRRVLIIDDDAIIGEFWKRTLSERRGLEVSQCLEGRGVAALLKGEPVDAIILDLNLPDASGLDLLAYLHRYFREIPVIVITAEDKVDTAVECMKAGAFDYVAKPVLGERLINLVNHALEIRELKERVDSLSGRVVSWDLKDPGAFKEIVTASEVMYDIFVYVEAVARSPRAVLVAGESGTGKELIARTIHAIGKKSGNFVAVNVAGLDDTLFADTLFGHLRGAYSGADSPRRGLIHQANQGTLFLDEIGDLTLSSQIKLLRLLQDGEYYPLGADTPEFCQARIITASNADLKALQETGKFRKDLYYRLMAHHIILPPLRDRQDDIALLTAHFAREAARQLAKLELIIPEEVLRLLHGYAFPGNIRELQSLVFDAVSRSESRELEPALIKSYLNLHRLEAGIQVGDLPVRNGIPSLQESEDFYIGQALKASGGNQTVAARILKVSQATISRWVRKQTDQG